MTDFSSMTKVSNNRKRDMGILGFVESKRKESSRSFVLRAYGVVSLLQNLLGICLIAAGLLSLRFYDKDEFDVTRPPYYIGAFLVGILIIMAGISTMYIYCTKAPVVDYYFLENSAVMRIRQAVTANTCISLLCLLACALGIFICVVFAIGPCDSDTWFAKCSFHHYKTENRFLALFVTMFEGAAFLVLLYSSLMGCIHGWVFDFDIVNIRVNGIKREERPVSLYHQADFFDMEEPAAEEDDPMVVQKYHETSSFRQKNNENRFSNETHGQAYQHEQSRKHHIPSQQQTPNYVAVLNDPAMKQKLQERNSKLQDT